MTTDPYECRSGMKKTSENEGADENLHLQRAPTSKPTTEFAQPRLSRVKGRSSPARGYKFGCVCSYIAGHEDARIMTFYIGTNAPKFVPSRWVWSSLIHVGSDQFRESLRELLRKFWFSHFTSRETPFREWDFAFRELFSELRELLREYRTLPELRE